jgi:hypothetical protein
MGEAMVRVVLVVFHLGLAALLSAELFLAAAQLRINALWETSFYGRTSATTRGFGGVIAIDVAVAALEVVVVLGYARGLSGSVSALLGVSALLLTVVTPAAATWVAASAGLLLAEEGRAALVRWLASEDEAADDDEG